MDLRPYTSAIDVEINIILKGTTSGSKIYVRDAKSSMAGGQASVIQEGATYGKLAGWFPIYVGSTYSRAIDLKGVGANCNVGFSPMAVKINIR